MLLLYFEGNSYKLQEGATCCLSVGKFTLTTWYFCTSERREFNLYFDIICVGKCTPKLYSSLPAAPAPPPPPPLIMSTPLAKSCSVGSLATPVILSLPFHDIT